MSSPGRTSQRGEERGLANSIPRFVLHATEDGRPLYTRPGSRPTIEMHLVQAPALGGGASVSSQEGEAGDGK